VTGARPALGLVGRERVLERLAGALEEAVAGRGRVVLLAGEPAALAGDQAETDRFMGVLTGSVALDSYFTPRNLARLVGLRGLGRMLLARKRAA
jgi:hypothetical protein